MSRLGPAHVDTRGLDLSVGAPGLVVELSLVQPVDLLPAPGGRSRETEPTPASAVLVVPSRPASLLEHARGRSLPVEQA
ncbi:MAG: hypothetical protein R2716_07885 [Microthrixaceae bacterium]